MKALRLLPFLCLLSLAIAAETATVNEILGDKAKYNGKAVIVTAKAFRFRNKISRIGKPYFELRIGTENSYLNVFGKERRELAIKDGEMVEVTGLFRAVKAFREDVYRNEIDVTKSLHPTYGVKVIKLTDNEVTVKTKTY